MYKNDLMAAALVLATLSTPSYAADRLSTAELRGLAPGRYAVSIFGLVKMTVTMQSGGTIQGVTSKQKSDSGRWTVQGEKFCITWNRWLKGKQRCTSLSGDAGQYSGGGLYIRKI